MSNDLREESKNHLRRVLGEMESLAPLPPELEDQSIGVTTPVRSRPKPLLVALGAAVAVFLLAAPLVWLMAGRGGGGPSTAPTDQPEVTSSTIQGPDTTASGADEREDLPQDGEPQAPSAAAIEATTTDGYYEIEIVTLAEDASQVESELEALGLDVSIDFVPVSPSLEGRLVVTDEPVDSQVEWEYVEPDDFGEPPTLRIPTNFDGTLRLHIGRPAEDGEAFISAATSALHPGEPLHCTDVEGMTVAEAAPVIAEAGVPVEYYDANGDGTRLLGDEIPQDWYIVSTTPVAGGVVQAELMATWPPDGRTAEYLAYLNDGCE